MPENSSFLTRTWKFIKKPWSIVGIIIVLAILSFLVFHKSKSPYTFIPVTRGSITASVSVTGNTTPIQSVTLGFENGGSVASVYSSVGQHAYAGQLLASLNVNDLSAQLRQAQANVDTQMARLASLKAGAQPEDVASSQAALDKSKQDLANMYSQISDIVNDAFSKANDAIRTQTNSLFSNPENQSVQLTFITSDTQSATNAKNERVVIGGMLNSWQTEVLTLSATSQPGTFDTATQNALSHLSDVHRFLLDISSALNSATNIDANTLAGYKANVATALTETNTATKNINTIAQNIASQKLIVAQTTAQLNLKKAGATQTDIDAQQAQVEQAEASVSSVQAKLSNSRIISPIDGVVTQFDAKIGQIASPGMTLVSIISASNFEVDAQVPETDIGRIAVGNIVDMTFDAFPGEKFVGKVFYIDPAQTVNQGVVDYKIKVSFDSVDPRIKSGLTSNLTIETKTDTGVLIVPQYAVLQTNDGTFVQKLIDGKASTTPVTLGIQDQNGNVEILSGVTEGEQVLNIGLKE